MSSQPIRFAGYAGIFDIPDAASDKIRRGAFTQTLMERETPLPLLWQHNANQQIGIIETAAEDERGLRVVARIDKPNSKGSKLLWRKKVNGLSFGFKAREFASNQDCRELFRIDMFEVSLVDHPLHNLARVHFIA
ncbi:MAG: HK97 family phage prohead protease [Erythrobacter sp.]